MGAASFSWVSSYSRWSSSSGGVECARVYSSISSGSGMPGSLSCHARELASLDGQIAPAAETTIPVTDEGFLRGDGVFEVIRVYDGVPFALDEHLTRLERSTTNLRLGLERPARPSSSRTSRTCSRPAAARTSTAACASS